MNNIKNLLNKVADCYIDNNGIFKYIQIKLYSGKETKIIVRGYKGLEYHSNNYDQFLNLEFESLDDIKSQPIGGGRININSEKKTIFVYGYSQGYGRCDHSLTCELIKTQYPDHIITWSDEGY